MSHHKRRLVCGLGGAAAALFLLVHVAPGLWQSPRAELFGLVAIVAALAPAISDRLGVVAVVQVVAAAASPISWPSAGITVFVAARHDRIGAAAAVMCSTIVASIANVLVVCPAWLDAVVEPQQQVLLVGTAVAGSSLLLLAGFAGGYRQRIAAHAVLARMQERDELVQRVEQARGAERERLTSELHDTLGNRIALLRAILEDEEEDPARRTAAAQLQVRKASDDLRALVSGRLDDASSSVSPIDRVREIVSEARGAGLAVSLSLDARLQSVRRPQQHIIFEVVREGITNALKYATPGLVVVVGEVRPMTVEVSVSSPALSSPPAKATGSGHGLRSLADRARTVQANFDYGIEHDRFVLRLSLPLVGDASEAPHRPPG